MELPKPFFVIATQNPVEQRGVYQLPEAQLDRFMIRINMNLPGYKDEIKILQSKREKLIPDVNQVITLQEIEKMQGLIEKVQISDQVLDYIARLIVRTRFIPSLSLGGSPRASLALMMMGRARAAMDGRTFVEPDDVKHLLYHVVNHRLILTPEAEIQQIPITQIVETIMKETDVNI
jgi:MoxR-like ATPase